MAASEQAPHQKRGPRRLRSIQLQKPVNAGGFWPIPAVRPTPGSARPPQNRAYICVRNQLYTDFLAFSSKAKKYYQTPASQMSAQGPTRPKATSKRSIERARGLSVVAEIATAVGGVARAPESEDRTWMWKLYLGFRRGFKLASDAGFVAFR